MACRQKYMPSCHLRRLTHTPCPHIIALTLFDCSVHSKWLAGKNTCRHAICVGSRTLHTRIFFRKISHITLHAQADAYRGHRHTTRPDPWPGGGLWLAWPLSLCIHGRHFARPPCRACAGLLRPRLRVHCRGNGGKSAFTARVPAGSYAGTWSLASCSLPSRLFAGRGRRMRSACPKYSRRGFTPDCPASNLASGRKHDQPFFVFGVSQLLTGQISLLVTPFFYSCMFGVGSPPCNPPLLALSACSEGALPLRGGTNSKTFKPSIPQSAAHPAPFGTHYRRRISFIVEISHAAFSFIRCLIFRFCHPTAYTYELTAACSVDFPGFVRVRIPQNPSQPILAASVVYLVRHVFLFFRLCRFMYIMRLVFVSLYVKKNFHVGKIMSVFLLTACRLYCTL